MSAAELFAGAGQSAGIEAWRIEKMAPVRNADAARGKLCVGDSYIILHSIPVKSGGFDYNLHFWLGDESSQDERGCAALFTIELDRFLGDKPVEFRELQGAESPEFLQCFDTGVQYLSGGVESGFVHVEKDSWPTRLLHVKGRRNVRVLEVPLAVSSLNGGDVFILDQGLALFVWNGAEASRAERAKGAEIARSIKNEERGGRAEISLLEQGGEGPEAEAFFHALGWEGQGFPSVASAEEGGADEEAEAQAAPRLFRLPQGGQVSAECEVTVQPLERSLLDTNSVCLLLAGGACYAWIGKAASPADKAGALASAAAACEFAGLPAATQQRVVKEGTEPPLFTQAFFRWHAPSSLPSFGLQGKERGPRTSEVVDVESLIRSAKEAAGEEEEGAVVEQPGSGSIQLWRIESFELAVVPAELHGQFYAGDSYVVLYTYRDASNRDAAFCYFWLGRDSSQDERAGAALQTKAVCDKMGGYPVQVRVVQGKEPGHFLHLWKGGMVVHAGGHPSGFKNSEEEAAAAAGSHTALYHVRGGAGGGTHAVQVDLRCGSLNSGDCFLLMQPGVPPSIWEGKYSSAEEKQVALSVALKLGALFGCPAGTQPEVLSEGGESDAFWAALGGKGEYSAFVEGPPPSQSPRLFQLCDAAAGGLGVRCEEVMQFSQDDLCDDDVMLLDVVSSVFLWVGNGATENEKREADALATRYVATCAGVDGRDADTPIIKVCAGEEPSIFTCHFLGWDFAKAAAFRDPLAERLKQAAAEEAAARAAAEVELAAAAAKKLNSLRLAEAARAAAKAEAKAAEEEAAKEAEAAKEEASRARAERFLQAEAEREAAKTPTRAAPPPPPGGVRAPMPPAPPAAAVGGFSTGAGMITVPPGSKTFPLESLRTMSQTAHGIDASQKEAYLTEAEYPTAFGCSRADFLKLPAWKRADAKKKAGLY